LLRIQLQSVLVVLEEQVELVQQMLLLEQMAIGHSVELTAHIHGLAVMVEL
jgi:hypothetical protein